MMHTNDFTVKVNELATLIEINKDEIVSILANYETHTTAKDETERSLITLRGLGKEMARVKTVKKANIISTFFPINLPLYSLILFAVAPSYFAGIVYVRVSGHIGSVLQELSEKLGLKELFSNIELKSYERKRFSDECVKKI